MQPDNRKHRVAIVDSNVQFHTAEVIAELLSQKYGFAAEPFSDLDSFRIALASRPFDALVLEWEEAPGTADGASLALTRKLQPNCPVVLLTNCMADHPLLKQAIEQYGLCYRRKPLEGAELSAMLHDLIDCHTVMNRKLTPEQFAQAHYSDPGRTRIVHAEGLWEAHCVLGSLTQPDGEISFANLPGLMSILAGAGIHYCMVAWDGVPAWTDDRDI
jgi:DNA-binding response OmpR family regulator